VIYDDYDSVGRRMGFSGGKERNGKRRWKGVFFGSGGRATRNALSVLLGRQSSTSEFGGVGYLCEVGIKNGPWTLCKHIFAYVFHVVKKRHVWASISGK
jgi:hypothetical protein